jgi:hypothetical protein
MDQYDEAYDAGHRAARRELAPLVEAVLDALLMFEDIKKARELPAYGNVQAQYIAMGNQLRRLLDISGLRDVIPPNGAIQP